MKFVTENLRGNRKILGEHYRITFNINESVFG